jgi:hypothetical protein
MTDVSTSRDELQPSAGTRGFWQAIQAGLRSPDPGVAAEDQQAVGAGGRRRVSCFIRLSYQRRFRQGDLEVSQTGATWHPRGRRRDRSLSVRRAGDPTTRLPGRRDIPLPRGIGHRQNGLLGSGGWTVLACVVDDDSAEIAVPSVDVGLVNAVLHGTGG